MNQTTRIKEATRLTFGDLTLDKNKREVLRGGSSIQGLSDKSFKLLWALATAAPKTLAREALMVSVWGGISVGDDALTQRVKIVREALGKGPEGKHYIQAVHGAGYRFQIQGSEKGQKTQKASNEKKIVLKWIFIAFLIFILYVILSEAGVLHLFHKWIN